MRWLISLVLFFLALETAGYAEVRIVLDVEADGSAMVTHIIEVTGDLDMAVVKLLSKPASEVLAYGTGGAYSVAIEHNGSGYYAVVFYPERGPLNITYVVTDLAEYSEGMWILRFNTSSETLVILPSGTVPINIPASFKTIVKVGDRYGIILPKGNHLVEYVVLIEIPKPGGGPEGWNYMDYVPYLAVTGLAIALLFLVLKKRRLNHSLDDTDRLIIEAVRRSGSITLSELVRKTSLPKTTVYRRVNRLAERGVLRIERTDGKKLIIKKK